MKIDSITLNHFPEGIRIQNNEQGKVSFSDVLKDSIQKVTELEKEADNEIEKLAKMETQDIHNTMMAIEKADMTFQMMMQIRNKIISAYEEIMRMQV
ncbi:MAG: Flagellar hook-basal body complex protein FliE [Syntrophorhabdus sp. PtaU1.Bin058]|nr:MAG: Flagellar hook-basal body complex protein FliE [Syntrophorhabdus sp. PtaU1.Bin058]